MTTPDPNVPRRFLVQIDVNVEGTGETTYKYKEVFSNRSLPDKILGLVAPADLIGFKLTAVVKKRVLQPPYRITFKNDGPFGMKVLDVPHGGGSGFFPVHALRGNHRYTVSLPGLGVRPDDPEIQMDATLMEIKRVQVDSFEVLLTYSAATGFAIAYEKNGSSFDPPNGILPILAGDKLVWRLDAGQSKADFEVVFEPRDEPPHRPVALIEGEDPEENVISGDIPDGNSPRRMTRVRTARRLQNGENSTFSYTVFSQGKQSDPPFVIQLTGLLE